MSAETIRFADIEHFLQEYGDSTAEEIARLLCPELSSCGSSKGGPDNGSVKVSFILGRMRQAGKVDTFRVTYDGVTRWRLKAQEVEREQA